MGKKCFRTPTGGRAAYPDGEERLAEANRLLAEEDGYLSGVDRRRLRRLVKEGVYCFEGQFWQIPQISRRVKSMRDRGIPAMFLEEFNTKLGEGTLFLGLEYLIIQGAGTAGPRYLAQKRNSSRSKFHRGGKEVKLVTPRCHLDDIISFAQRAFDSGELNVHFARDMDYRMTLKADSINHDNYTNRINHGLSWLKEKLTESELIPQTTHYKKTSETTPNVTPKEALKPVFRNGLWYMDYSPEDREKMARNFIQAWTSKDVSRVTKTYRRMQALFPEIIPDTEDMKGRSIKHEYDQAIQSGAFQDVPGLIFTDPAYKTYKADFLTRVHQRIQTVGPEILNPMGHPLAVEVGVSLPVIYMRPVANAVHARRLVVAKSMNDTEFLQHFEKQRVRALGHRKSEHPIAIGEGLRAYVITRYNELTSE